MVATEPEPGSEPDSEADFQGYEASEIPTPY